MFWLCWILQLISGLPRNLTKDKLKSRLPYLSERFIEKTLIVCFVLAALLTAIRYYTESSSKNKIRAELDALHNYSWVATLNPKGTTLLDEGSGLKMETSISRVLEGVVWKESGIWKAKCDDESLTKVKRVMELNSKFPFSYVMLSDCLSRRGDPLWKAYAKKAIKIFEKTTTLADHHPTHDKAFKRLVKLLKAR